jgi:murein L,D-transpeptidase YafK
VDGREQYGWTVGARRTLFILAVAFSFIGCQTTNERFTFETYQAVPHVDKVLVKKKDHKLLLMNGDVVVKSYSIALARGGLEPKQRQGDHKTPEGLYLIDSRNQMSRFHRALHVSYPSEADKERTRKLGMDPGGDIMIHGIQNGLGWLKASQRLIDWTDGCIAVTDEEIEEIWNLVPNGTPIEIRP